MKNVTKGLIGGVVTLCGLVAGNPVILQWVAAAAEKHKALTVLITTVGMVSALIHNPQQGS